MCFCSNSFMFIPVSKRCRLLLFPESGLNKKVTQHNKVGCLGKIKGNYNHEISLITSFCVSCFCFLSLVMAERMTEVAARWWDPLDWVFFKKMWGKSLVKSVFVWVVFLFCFCFFRPSCWCWCCWWWWWWCVLLSFFCFSMTIVKMVYVWVCFCFCWDCWDCV